MSDSFPQSLLLSSLCIPLSRATSIPMCCGLPRSCVLVNRGWVESSARTQVMLCMMDSRNADITLLVCQRADSC